MVRNGELPSAILRATIWQDCIFFLNRAAFTADLSQWPMLLRIFPVGTLPPCGFFPRRKKPTGRAHVVDGRGGRDFKKLALEGRSATLIAATLGAPTRNAVIGKANRIGIRLNGDGRSTSPSRTAAAPRVAPLATVSLCAPAHTRREPERKRAWTFAEAEVGEMRRLRFEEASALACRWPIGEPGAADFAYCGLDAAQGRPYCAGHCRMAYRPPQARQSRSAEDRRSCHAFAYTWRVA